MFFGRKRSLSDYPGHDWLYWVLRIFCCVVLLFGWSGLGETTNCHTSVPICVLTCVHASHKNQASSVTHCLSTWRRSLTEWETCILAELAGQRALLIPCLCPNAGVTGTYSSVQLFILVLGIPAQVLMLGVQVLLPNEACFLPHIFFSSFIL